MFRIVFYFSKLYLKTNIGNLVSFIYFVDIILCIFSRFHNWRYNLPQGPHPLVLPPHLHHIPPPRTAFPFLPLQAPPQVILVPVHVRGSFPPFIERIVQRIQTWWSFYNPPEFLTRPPPSADAPTTNSPKKKVTFGLDVFFVVIY